MFRVSYRDSQKRKTIGRRMLLQSPVSRRFSLCGRSRARTVRIVAFRDDEPEAAPLQDSLRRSRTEEKAVVSARQWLHAFTKAPKLMDGILAPDCVQHVDDMWLPLPLRGLPAIKAQAEEFRSLYPGYQAQVLEAASGIDAGGGFSDFIFWRGSVPPQDSGAGEAFSHMGLERHRRKHRGGPVTDIFVYSGPTRDQANRLLVNPKRPFDSEAWETIPHMSDMEEETSRSRVPVGVPAPPSIVLTKERRIAMDASAAMLLGLLAGIPNIPSFDMLQQHMTHTVVLQEETRVWDSHGMGRVHGIAELVARVAQMTAWVRADAGFPLILSKAYTEDGLHMFVHSENVTHDVRSGLRSAAHGLLLLVFDPFANHLDSARISRVISCRGPTSPSEKSLFFDVHCCKPWAKVSVLEEAARQEQQAGGAKVIGFGDGSESLMTASQWDGPQWDDHSISDDDTAGGASVAAGVRDELSKSRGVESDLSADVRWGSLGVWVGGGSDVGGEGSEDVQDAESPWKSEGGSESNRAAGLWGIFDEEQQAKVSSNEARSHPPGPGQGSSSE